MKLRMVVTSLALVAGLGCDIGQVTDSRLPSEPVSRPRDGFGFVRITTQTSGTNIDPGGFMIMVDGWWDYTHPPTDIAPNDTVTLSMWSGARLITLYDLSENCRGLNLVRDIVVRPDSVSTVDFQVACK